MFNTSMSHTILLKSVVALAKGYFDKDPTKKLTISLNDISKYINDNHSEFHAEVVIADSMTGDVKIILSKKSVTKN